MNKFVFRIVFVIALIVGSYYYMASDDQIAPPDFTDTILLRETMSAMGAKTITTVHYDGKVSVISDFYDRGGSYVLNKQHLDKVTEMIISAGPKIRRFQPSPNVLYDGTYSLETNINSYIRHTKTDKKLQALLDYIKTSWQVLEK